MDEKRHTQGSPEPTERTSAAPSGQGGFGAGTHQGSVSKASQGTTAHTQATSHSTGTTRASAEPGSERSYASEHEGGPAYGRSQADEPLQGSRREDYRTRDFRRGVHQKTSTHDELGSPSVIGTIRGLARDIGLLARQEAQLARVEIGEKVDQAKRGVAELAIGAAVAYAGLLFVLVAITFALDLAIANLWLSFLIVGGVTLIVGLLLLAAAKKNLEPENLVPEKTARSLREDADMVRDHTRRTHV